MFELFYIVFFYFIQFLIWIWFWVCGCKVLVYCKCWGECYGFYCCLLKLGGIMLYFVLVGEILVVILLVCVLCYCYFDLFIIVMIMMLIGLECVQFVFGNDVQYVYLFYDLFDVFNCFFNKIDFKLVLIMEIEFWLNLIVVLYKCYILLVIVNVWFFVCFVVGYVKFGKFVCMFLCCIILIVV